MNPKGEDALTSSATLHRSSVDGDIAVGLEDRRRLLFFVDGTATMRTKLEGELGRCDDWSGGRDPVEGGRLF